MPEEDMVKKAEEYELKVPKEKNKDGSFLELVDENVREDSSQKKIDSLLVKLGGVEDRKKCLKKLSEATGKKVEELESRCKTIEEKGLCHEDGTPKEFTLPESISPSRISAATVGKNIEMKGRILGEKTKKVLPKLVRIHCESCGQSEIHNIKDEPRRFLFKGRKRTDNVMDELKSKLSCRCNDDTIKTEIIEKMDYAIIYISNLLEETEKFTERSNRPITAHVLDSELPNAKEVKINGFVTSHPVSNDLVVIGREITPLETESHSFEVTESDKNNFGRYFKDGDIDMRNQIAPDMVGRPLVQKSRLLVLHSPPEIPEINNGKIIRGCLREIYIGDTKTYKSESIKDVTRNHYTLGGYCTAETGSRTGLVYTINQDRKALIWGEIPLNDLGYVGIDGLNALHSEEMQQLREILEDQRVTVRRSVSGEALARTRITGAMNPGKKKQKPMNQYLYKCEAIKDTYIFQGTPDITRWDIFLPFSSEDVAHDKIVSREPESRPIQDEVFKRHVYWAWSRKPEQIEYEQEAKELIIKESSKFLDKYQSSSIPIVHEGVRDVLTRLSVAQACLNHSTESEHEKVIVRREDCGEAVEFYRKILDDLELAEFKQQEEGKLNITGDEFNEMVGKLSERQIKILEKLTEARTSSDLGNYFDVDKKTIKRDCEPLKEYDLVRSIPGRGYELTARGVKFLKRLKNIGESDRKCPDVTGDKKGTTQNEKSSGSSRGQNLSDIGTENAPFDEKIQKVLEFLEENPESTALDISSAGLGIKLKEAEEIIDNLRENNEVTSHNRGFKLV